MEKTKIFRDKKRRKKKERVCVSVFTKRGSGNLDNISPVMTYRQYDAIESIPGACIHTDLFVYNVS